MLVHAAIHADDVVITGTERPLAYRHYTPAVDIMVT